MAPYLKCSQQISSSNNKKILLTTRNVRLDSGRYATKYQIRTIDNQGQVNNGQNVVNIVKQRPPTKDLFYFHCSLLLGLYRELKYVYQLHCSSDGSLTLTEKYVFILIALYTYLQAILSPGQQLVVNNSNNPQPPITPSIDNDSSQSSPHNPRSFKRLLRRPS